MNRDAGARRRLVLVAPNWLGDAVMSLPVIDRVAAAGAFDLAVVTAPYTARVYWGVDGVGELHVDRPGSRWSRIRSRAAALRAYGADTVVVLPPSFSSALPAWLAHIRRRIGFAADARRILLSDAVPVPSRRVHLTDSYVELVERTLPAVNTVHSSPPTRARIRVTDEDRAGAVARVSRAGIRGAYALVVPGAAFGPAKSWPALRYRAVCDSLAREIAVVLTGSAADRPVCDEIAAGLPGVVNLAGQTTLGEFFALVEGARVVLANDSGAPHVAATLGTPTVVLFGSTSPEWTAPRGARVDVVQHKVHCNPCFRRTCPTQLECFHGIEPAEVLSRVRGVLAA